jgi:hypothetical protein
LLNEELRDLYSSPSIVIMIKSRRMRWEGHLARKGEGEKSNTYSSWVGKPGRKRPLGRRRRICVDNIKIDLGVTERGSLFCVGLAQNKDATYAVIAVIKFTVP